MNRSHQALELREVQDDGRTFTAIAVRYNEVDDYDTVFLPGCFTTSLQQRMPRIAWGHDWGETIGRVISYQDTTEALIITARLSDPEAVPRAKQAMAQLRDGDITDVSVGFLPHETKQMEGRTAFVRADLDEVSCVLRGAVPGARVLSIRARGNRSMVVDAELAGKVIAAYASGSTSLVDALQTIQSASVETPESSGDEEELEPEVEVEVEEEEEPKTEPEVATEPEQGDPIEVTIEPEQVDNTELLGEADAVFGSVLSA